jgi:hypothetical protein
MTYRLRSQKNPSQTLTLSRSAWLWLLDCAEQSGWQPMGTVHQDMLVGLGSWLGEMEMEGGTYTPGTSRLVMLEDALNLMDALEQVFETYEHAPESPSAAIFRTEWDDLLRGRPRPGIGSLVALADLCRAGPFLIEAHRTL